MSSSSQHQQWHQSGPAPPHPGDAGTYTQFAEPVRSRDVTPPLLGLPPWLVAVWFRIKNGLAVCNFFAVYCLNAFLNVAIYSDYMQTHGADSLRHRTAFENAYIATLAAPLVDVIVRCLARNFFKLNLAKSQSHCSGAPSLAVCTPSLNAYALLIMRGNPKTILFAMMMDAAEIAYSYYMWRLQPVKTFVLWVKLGFLVFTSILIVWDIVVIFQKRRFLGNLPTHMHPIYVCWDVNNRFHWQCDNNVFDVLEQHEDLSSSVFTSAEGRIVRQRIAEWNEGENEILTWGAQPPSPHDHQHDDDDDSEAEHQSLLAARR